MTNNETKNQCCPKCKCSHPYTGFGRCENKSCTCHSQDSREEKPYCHDGCQIKNTLHDACVLVAGKPTPVEKISITCDKGCAHNLGDGCECKCHTENTQSWQEAFDKLIVELKKEDDAAQERFENKLRHKGIIE